MPRSTGLAPALVLCSALCTFTAPLAADRLSGRILDPQGRVVPHADIRLLDRTGGPPHDTVAAPDGGYAFEAIPPGAYLIAARGADGALSGAAEVTVDGDRRLDLTLAITGRAADVVVTASSTPQAGREVARSVDVIDAPEIARHAHRSIPDALRTLPGMRVRTLSGPGSLTTIQTRGLRTQDTALLIDGLRFRDAASPQGDASGFLGNLTLADTDRIEVLRGAGSTLYGSNAMGGVINVLSHRGGGPARGDLLLEGGGLGLVRTVPSARGGLANDRLTWSGALAWIDARRGVRGANPYRSAAPQGALRYHATPALALTGRVWHTDDRVQTMESPTFPDAVTANFPSDGPVRAIALPTDQLARIEQGLPFDAGTATFAPSRNDPDSRRDSSFLNGAATLRHMAAPGVVYRVGYQGVATGRTHRDGPLGSGSFEPAALRHDRFDGRIDTVQARLDAAVGLGQTVSAGYEFERETFANSASDHAASVRIATRSHAIYAQDHLDLLDGRLQLTVGGRVQAFALQDPAFTGARHPYAGVAFDAPTAVTGEAAAAYVIGATDTTLRGHAGTSYRAPALFERFGGSFSSFSRSFSYWGDPRLRPERARSIDGGVDQRLLDGRLRISATAFHIALQETIRFDVVTVRPDSDPFGRSGGYRNAGGGRARGLELSLQAATSAAGRLRAAYTWTDAISDTPTIGDDYFGRPGISRHLFTLTASQRIARRVTVAVDLAAASDYAISLFGAQGRRLVFDGPITADLVVRYDLPTGPSWRMDLYAHVQNLLDRIPYENGVLGPGRWGVGGVRIRY